MTVNSIQFGDYLSFADKQALFHKYMPCAARPLEFGVRCLDCLSLTSGCDKSRVHHRCTRLSVADRVRGGIAINRDF